MGIEHTSINILTFITCYEANVATTTFTDTFGQWECKLLNTSHCLIMIKT